MKSETKAINRLTDVRSKVSCHYFVKRNGTILLMVPDFYKAWHSGKSKWKNKVSLNNNSIGIEISNKGHQFGYQSFSKKQIISLVELSKYLIKKFNISKKNILGHSDISSDRKKDPGEKFPWKYLAKKKVGIWHDFSPEFLKKLRNIKVRDSDQKKMYYRLNSIGYSIGKISNKHKIYLIKAFQRRFRPELINGKIDQECLLIAKKLSKLFK